MKRQSWKQEGNNDIERERKRKQELVNKGERGGGGEKANQLYRKEGIYTSSGYGVVVLSLLFKRCIGKAAVTYKFYFHWFYIAVLPGSS